MAYMMSTGDEENSAFILESMMEHEQEMAEAEMDIINYDTDFEEQNLTLALLDEMSAIDPNMMNTLFEEQEDLMQEMIEDAFSDVSAEDNEMMTDLILYADNETMRDMMFEEAMEGDLGEDFKDELFEDVAEEDPEMIIALLEDNEELWEEIVEDNFDEDFTLEDLQEEISEEEDYDPTMESENNMDEEDEEYFADEFGEEEDIVDEDEQKEEEDALYYIEEAEKIKRTKEEKEADRAAKRAERDAEKEAKKAQKAYDKEQKRLADAEATRLETLRTTPGQPEWMTDAGSLGYTYERAYFKGKQIEDIYLSATPAYAGTILYTTPDTLPLGLTLYDSGQIGGTISQTAISQDYSFEVTAEDQANFETTVREFSIFVNEPGVAWIKPEPTVDTISVSYTTYYDEWEQTDVVDWKSIPLLAATSHVAGQNYWGDDMYESLEFNLISSNPTISNSGLELASPYFDSSMGTISSEFTGQPTSFYNDTSFVVTIKAKETNTPAFNSVRNLTITILADPDYVSPS